jgi:hypothetical protein
MKVTHLDVLVEEPSMEALLRQVLPRIVPTMTFDVFTHSSKDDLLRSLPQRLKGYARWLPETTCVVVVVDRDDDDCVELKRQLEAAASNAGLITRSKGGHRVQVINRIAIEELEAWYFGDWEAVRTAYPRVPATVPQKVAFRHSDRIKGGTWEALERVLNAAGYFAGGLRKIEAARSIGEHMTPERSKSPSFIALRDALRELVQSAGG